MVIQFASRVNIFTLNFKKYFPNSIWFLDTMIKILRFIPRPLENKRERYVFANTTLCSKFYDWKKKKKTFVDYNIL